MKPITREWQDRSDRVLAQKSTSPVSKRPDQFINGIYPSHLEGAHSCFVRDPFGHEYIDFVSGLGAVSLGYCHPKVNDAIKKQMERGISFSLPSTLEVDVAEKLLTFIPFVDRVRFLKTGNEACAAAVRIARSKTKKAFVYVRGYHGHHEFFTGLTPPADGITGTFHMQSLADDLTQLESERNLAAVIVEAAELTLSEDWQRWLKNVRDICRRKGAAFIVDEVVTGFRVPQWTLSRLWSLEPDIICLGKGIANGMPLSVVAGKSEWMDEPYFVSSTFSGETLSLAACKATLQELADPTLMENLLFYGERLRSKLNGLHDEIKFNGYGTRAMLNVDMLPTALFMQEMCKQGVLLGKAWFFNVAHLKENIETRVLETAEPIVKRIKNNQVTLEGQMPQQAFKR